MPCLDNHKHERFAQNLAKGLSASKAYEKAGYKPNDGNAIRLKGNERIAERVKELQETGAQRAEMTIEGHLSKLKELRDEALKAKQYNAAINAEQLRGKVSGFYIDRQQVEGTMHYTVDSEPLSPEEWEHQYGEHATH